MLLQNKNGFDEFATAIRERESNNDYAAVNQAGYLGAYQFGMARLCDLGLTERITGTTGYGNECFKWRTEYSQDNFLKDSSLQDYTFKKHVALLKESIINSFSSMIGSTRFETLITLSGLVAGAHLLGLGAVRKFVELGINGKDGNGTSIKSYIVDFQGYKL